MAASARTLRESGGYPFELVYSPEAEKRAHHAAALVAGALPVLSQAVGFSPRLRLMVLTKADWPQYATRQTFGAPENVHGDTIIIGSQPAAFWNEVLEMIEPVLPPPDAARLRELYGERQGHIDCAAFTDLVVLHQLGHIFHQQVPFEFPRRWLRELFADLCVYTAVAEAFPERLPHLETLPLALSETPSQLASRRTLVDFDRVTVDDSVEHFVWYQFRLVLAAKAIYDSSGPGALRRFFDLFLRFGNRPLQDEDLADLLERKVAPEAATLMRDWPLVG